MKTKKVIQLSSHFTYRNLLIFTLPSIFMMIFNSLYEVVDGYFVSNYAGKTPFAAVNFIMPFLMVMGAPGFMFGTGGSALVAKAMGEGDKKRANRIFSMLIYVSIACGIVISIFGLIFIRPVASVLGAEGELLENCVKYGRIIIFALPAYILQLEFQSFFIAAERPQLGLIVTLAAGITNIILDFLLVAVFSLGLKGAAFATAVSQSMGGIIPLIYFFSPNKSLLHMGKTRFDSSSLLKACTNGSSELMSNVSMSLVNMLYNFQLMKYAGENGVAAFGALMYVNMIFLSAFIGYSIGTAPIVSFNYGAENHEELKGLLKKSMLIVAVFALFMFTASRLLATSFAELFTGYDRELCTLTRRAFLIFSFSFLFAGFAIYGSCFFTALNDGLTSALIAFSRTLVCQSISVLIMPLFWQIDGIWASMITAEIMAAAIAILFIYKKRKVYLYL